MTDFILVPGAWHGGWWYAPVVGALEARGHRAHAVTLEGLGDSTGRQVTLDTHIEQLDALVTGVGGPVVLVGHSYGGMVVTAVADRRPDLVRALVYLDADVPPTESRAGHSLHPRCATTPPGGTRSGTPATTCCATGRTRS